MSRTYFPGVDVVKFVMAFAVVLIHSYSTSVMLGYGEDSLAEPVVWFMRLAVPLFFVISGYFLGRKIYCVPKSDVQEVEQYMGRRARQLFRVWGVWMAIYFPTTVYYYLSNDYTFGHAARDLIREAFLYGEGRLAWPLWFIYSMAIFFLAFRWLLKHTRHPLAIGVVLFSLVTVNVWASESGLFSGGVGKVSDLVRMLTVRTCGGGLYMLVGMLMARFPAAVKLPWALGALAVSYVVRLMELPGWAELGGYALTAFGLLAVMGNHGVVGAMRRQSMWVYYTHMIFLVGYVICYRQGVMDLSVGELFAAVSLCSWGLAALLARAEKVASLRWLSSLVG